MVFQVVEKIALVTGGASGIGLHYVKELLRNGAKGVTLADIDRALAEDALKEIEKEFGDNKAIFVLTDVTKYEQVKNAFEKTVEHFKNIDIVVNNAGILNDAIWEKQIVVNLNGTIHGILLSFHDFLQKYRQTEEGLIVNISSTCGTEGVGFIPIYAGTKHAIIGLTKSWGIPDYYQETGIRIVAICPGVTITPLINESSGRNLGPMYQRCYEKDFNKFVAQSPEHLAKEAIKVMKYAPNGTTWIIEGCQNAYEFIVPDHRATTKNNLPIAQWRTYKCFMCSGNTGPEPLEAPGPGHPR